MRRYIKKNMSVSIVAIVLVIATIVGIMFNESAFKSKANESYDEIMCDEEYDDNNEGYEDEGYANAAALAAEIELQEVVDVKEFERSDESLVVTSYRADGSKIESIYSEITIIKKYYNNDNENFFMEVTDLTEYSDDMLDMDFSQDDQFAESGDDEIDEFDDISRGGVTKGKNGLRVYEWCNFKHWYQWRNNKKGLRIGCDASYNINYSKLDKGKKANCKEYTQAIYDSNKMIALFAAKVAAFLAVPHVASPIVITILDLSSQGLGKESIKNYLTKRYGKKLIIGATIGKVVAVVDTANTVYTFVSNRAKVKKYYKLIRKYGKKIS